MEIKKSVVLLDGVGPAKKETLAKIGITSIKDLLYWLPRKYIDCTNPSLIESLQYGQMTAILADIKSVSKRRTRGRKTIVEAKLEDETGSIEAIWFNQSYIEPLLQRMKRGLFVGPVRAHYQTRRLIMAAPKIEKKPTILPIYPLTAGLTSRQINKLASAVLARTELKETLTKNDLDKLDLVDINKALRYLHNPNSLEEVRAGRRRVIFDELFSLQKKLAKIKLQYSRQAALKIKADAKLLQKFVSSLPFKLTDDQRKAIWQMAQELERGNPMHRLLNGDVGSGKTVVAAALALLVFKAKSRTVLMVPTEILAIQHAQSLTEFLSSFGIRVGLVTAFEKDFSADILVGTHALISDQAKLENVALVVVDEQHRFGVAQREKLRQKVTDSDKLTSLAPHFLTLTATPIPRSLALALFGDLDITILKQMPANRIPINTEVLRPATEHLAFEAIRAAAGRHEQSFVVCPLIEEQSGDAILLDEKKSVTEIYRRLTKEIFPNLKIKMLHGQIKSEQKEKILRQFQQGEFDVLVATSVVEVGVDIPAATVMFIEGAENFGVAQLHQLRGRIGRRDKQAQCFFMVRQDIDLALARAQKVASSTDGFELAHFDLQKRGPGELVGLAQKGINHLFLENLDFELLAQAQDLARKKVITA